jgi:hypothetical protein
MVWWNCTGIETNQSSQAEADATTGHSTFYTGQSDLRQMRQLIEFNGQTSLVACPSSGCPPGPLVPAWDSAAANLMPLASEGVQFYPNLDRTQPLPVFVEQCNRALLLECLQSVELYGVELLRFTVRPDQIQNASVNPANAAYDLFGPEG